MPSTVSVKFAVIEVALEKVTEFAVTIAPVDELIASTKGTDWKLAPVITTFEALLSMTVGLIEDIVGLVSATVLKDNTPDPFVVNACPFVPSAAG